MAAHVLNDLVIINCTSPNVDPNNECIHILTSIGRHHTTVKQVISSHIHRVYTSTFNKWFLSTFFETDTSHVIEVPLKQKKRVTVKGQSLCFEFLDSNHCPGSVMVLMKGSFGTYLYTGNCRYSPQMLMNASLRPFCNGTQRLDKLFVNAAYQQLSRNFPSREAVTRRLLSFLRKHSNEIIYICCRLLGKEDLVARIATELDVKVCLSQDKLKVMRKLGYNTSLFVTEQHQAHIRVVGIEEMSWLKMKRRQESEKCVAVVLTGMETDKHKLKKYGIFVFPFSDHNSAEETVIMTSSIRSKEVIYLNVNNSSKENVQATKVIQQKSDKKEEKSSSSEGSDRRIFFEIGPANTVPENTEEKRGRNSNSSESMSSISFRISRSSSDGDSTGGNKIVPDTADKKGSRAPADKKSSGSVSLIEGSEEAIKHTTIEERKKSGFWGSISDTDAPSSIDWTGTVATGNGTSMKPSSAGACDQLTSKEGKEIFAKRSKKKGLWKEVLSDMELTGTVSTGKSTFAALSSVAVQQPTGQEETVGLWGSLSSLEPPSAMELTGITTAAKETTSAGLSSEASDERTSLTKDASAENSTEGTWGSISSIDIPSGIQFTESNPTGKENMAGGLLSVACDKQKSVHAKEACVKKSKKSSWGSISSIEAPSGIELTRSIHVENAKSADLSSANTEKQRSGQAKEISVEKSKEKDLWGSISSIEAPSGMELTGSILSRKENTIGNLPSVEEQKTRKSKKFSVKKSKKKNVWGSASSIDAPSSMELTGSIPAEKENKTGSVSSVVYEEQTSVLTKNNSTKKSKQNILWGSISSIEAPSGMELTGSICTDNTTSASSMPKQKSTAECESLWTTAFPLGSRPKRKVSQELKRSEHWTTAVSCKSLSLKEKTGKWERSTTYGSMSIFSDVEMSKSPSVSPISFGPERTEISPTPESAELDPLASDQIRESSLRSQDSVPELPTIVEAMPTLDDLPPVGDMWSLPSSPECPPGPSQTLMELTQCCAQVGLESDSPPSSPEKSPSFPTIIPGLTFNHKIYEQFHSRCPHLWPSRKLLKK